MVAAEVANGVQQVGAPKSGSKPAAAAAKEATPPPPAAAAAKPAPPQEKKAEKKKKEKAAAPPQQSEPEEVHVGRLDMRVGLIRKATKHPDADSLYVEEVRRTHLRRCIPC